MMNRRKTLCILASALAVAPLLVTIARAAEPSAKPHRIAILGDYQDGTFRTAVGELAEHDISWTIDAQPVGVAVAGSTLACFVDNKVEPLPLHPTDQGPGRWMIGGSVSTEQLDGDPIYCGARLPDGTTWLVGSHENWKWN